MMKKFFSLTLGLFFLIFFSLKPAFGEEQNETVCLVYFTGIGCSHCAQTDPVVLEQLLQEYPNLKIIEYEIYQERENAPLLDEYNDVYASGLGIPLIVFGQERFLIGDTPIVNNIRREIEKGSNPCPLIDGSSVGFEGLDLSSLPGKPKIWPQSGGETDLSGATIETELTLPKILSLAAVDAVNPCALAVLTLMLMAILAFAPKKRKNILLAGLAFTFSVFVMYLFYGLVIIRFFQLIKALTSIRLWLYKALGIVAIILGLLNLKDFFKYKPGSFLTEMPMFMRPRMKELMFKVTSPRGAFLVGAFVTIFLLPCTIGPYVICGGILCTFDLLETIPWLLLYNLIFILPMLAITVACYIGFTTVEDISGWREKNIKYLHLAAGLIIFGLGIAMVLGLV
jgi:thiol-disulfide isomerase/thioredoxin